MLESPAGAEAAKAAAERAYKAYAVEHHSSAAAARQPAAQPAPGAAPASSSAADSSQPSGSSPHVSAYLWEWILLYGEACMPAACIQLCTWLCWRSALLEWTDLIRAQQWKATLTEPIAETCAAAAKPPGTAGSEQSPASASSAASTEPAASSTSAAAPPAAATASTQVGAANNVRQRRAGVDQILPAEPPGTNDGPGQGPHGVAQPELVNVFSWKVLTLTHADQRCQAGHCSHCMVAYPIILLGSAARTCKCRQLMC